MQIFLYTDGASRCNPWESWGWFIAYDSNKNLLFSWKKYFWIKTNNQSEYLALIAWIKNFIDFINKNPWDYFLNILMDSELIVKQINWEYRVKDPDLKLLFSEVIGLLKWIKFTIKHIERSLNKEADKLSNLAIDRRDF